MKRLLLGILCLSATSAFPRMAPAADADVVNPDSTGFTFTDIKIVPTTPVKNQNKSGTCWSFATVSLLEEDILRRGGKEVNLSEMYNVRNCYIDKAKNFIRKQGKTNFAAGGTLADGLYVLENYGVVPESAYTGLNYGESNHNHGELNALLDAYLKVIVNNPNKKLSSAWLPGYIGILDAYLGKVPETFVVDGKTYTPKEYAKALGLDRNDFVSFTSFTHHPFYQEFILELADNWNWDKSMNIPVAELKEIVDNALENGYTVCWAADVSEGGFQWRNGFALLPQPKTGADLEGTELSRWVKLSAKDKEDDTFKIKGPVKEREVTQESRQNSFDNFETTDDHAMIIMGVATDQEGNRYYKVKNSWDTNQVYDGFIYVSEPYFLEKTLSIIVNKGAVPKSIAKKTGL